MLTSLRSTEPEAAPRVGRKRWPRVYGYLMVALLGCLAVINSAALAVYFAEVQELKRIATGLVAPTDNAMEKAGKVASFVVEKVPTRRVEAYFLLPIFRPLKPTALQIIRGGGDCAYKARAFIVLLKHLGVQATKIALHDAAGRPVHAVAVADTPQGRVVVDLLYGIVYTDRDGSPIPLEELAINPSRMNEVLDREIARGNVRAARYPRDRYGYYDVRTMNWDKSWATAALHKMMGGIFGQDHVNRWRRPQCAEEPAQMVAVMSGALVVAGTVPYWWRCLRLPSRAG
jgi:hypothetical protein